MNDREERLQAALEKNREEMLRALLEKTKAELEANRVEVFRRGQSLVQLSDTIQRNSRDKRVWEERAVALYAEVDFLRKELALVRTHYQDVWFWQGDGLDAEDSLTCPVVMPADKLREFVLEIQKLRIALVGAAG